MIHQSESKQWLLYISVQSSGHMTYLIDSSLVTKSSRCKPFNMPCRQGDAIQVWLQGRVLIGCEVYQAPSNIHMDLQINFTASLLVPTQQGFPARLELSSPSFNALSALKDRIW